MDEKVQLAIEAIAKSEGLHDFVIETSGVLKGSGFMGIITPMKIIGKNNKNESQTLNYIMKTASKSDAFRKEVPIQEAFQTESFMYSTVLPTLKSFEIKRGLTPTIFAPKLYYTLSDDKCETLILKDLRSEYKLHPAGCLMGGDYVSLGMEKYGKLHAISFALRDQEPEKFRELTDQMKNSYIPCCRTITKSILDMGQKALAALNSEEDLEAIEKYKTFMASIDPICDDILSINNDDRYCVILHGDSWSNNQLFTHQDEKNPDKPTGLRFIDFQMSRSEYPVTDLANFIYCSGNKETLDSLDHYLKIYYESFSNHLRKLGGDPDVSYPFNILMEHWRRYAKFYLYLIPMFLHYGEEDVSQSVDLEKAAESDSNFEDALIIEIPNIDMFNDRMRHAILHFVKNDFI